MSAAAVAIRTLLIARAEVTQHVPPARIRVGEYPASLEMPGILVTEVDANEIPTVARRRANSTIQARVQVTVYATTYDQQEAILRAAKLGAGVHTGVIADYHINSIMPAGIGPALPPAQDGIFERSRDFMVTFKEAN